MDITSELILTFVATLIGSQGLWILLSKISEKRSATSQLIRGLAHEQIVDKGMQYILPTREMIADDIGIITDGVLGYQDRINREENLEQLFMDTVQKSRRGND